MASILMAKRMPVLTLHYRFPLVDNCAAGKSASVSHSISRGSTVCSTTTAMRLNTWGKTTKNALIRASQPTIGLKSKGLNNLLWVIVCVVVVTAAFGNVYFVEQYSAAIRVVGVVVLLAIALAIAALTNQGKTALSFFGESRTELRRIVWPTRSETMQTTLIVMGVAVITALILWGLDGIIIGILNFLTDLRF